MAKWKLYWVSSDGVEDCFVVAKNSRSAAYVEIHMNGFDIYDVEASRVMDIPDKYEEIANNKFIEWSKINAPSQVNDKLKAWPSYAEPWLFEVMEIPQRTINGEKHILIDDIVYVTNTSGENRKYSIGARAILEDMKNKNINYEKYQIDYTDMD